MAELQLEADKVPNTPDEHPQDIERIEELQAYLDMVKKMTRPGCSEEVLKVAVDSMSSLVRILSVMSSTPKPRSLL